MSNVYQLPDRERCLDEAGRWLARLDRGLDESETRAFQRWLAAGGGNREAFMQMAELWDGMDAMARLADLFPPPAGGRRGLSPPRHWLALAAGVLLLAGVVLWRAGALPGANPPGAAGEIANLDRPYETEVGEQSTVNLPDGSVLVLNTDSRARVRYSRDHRLIELERGELNVRVARDEERPLSVFAGGQVVQAVGTAFNVQLLNSGRVDLIVTEGRVRVAERAGGARRLPDSATAVSRGERLVMKKRRPQRVEKIAPEDMEAKLSWRTGKLVFRGEPLERALAEVSRYTRVRFRIEGEGLKQVRVAGLFRAGDVKGLLGTLDSNFDIASEHIDARTVILRAR